MYHILQKLSFFSNNGGDVRFYNNIFLKNDSNVKGLTGYNQYPTIEECNKFHFKNTREYISFKFPVWIESNVYLNRDYRFVKKRYVRNNRAKLEFNTKGK